MVAIAFHLLTFWRELTLLLYSVMLSVNVLSHSIWFVYNVAVKFYIYIKVLDIFYQIYSQVLLKKKSLLLVVSFFQIAFSVCCCWGLEGREYSSLNAFSPITRAHSNVSALYAELCHELSVIKIAQPHLSSFLFCFCVC